MTCPGCGAWAPGDPETGYDADELCPACKAKDIAGEPEPVGEPEFDRPWCRIHMMPEPCGECAARGFPYVGDDDAPF